MKPGEQLYNRFEEGIQLATLRLYADEETRVLTNSLLRHARVDCDSVSVPRLGHYRTALQRQMNPEGVAVPDGKVYKTSSYEDFRTGNGQDTIGTIEYENKLLIQTSDDDGSKGRVLNFIDKLFDDRSMHKGTFVVFDTVAPKDVSDITSVESLTYAVVQVSSGEAFGFTFRDNPNKGKVMPTQGHSDEWGGVRDRAGLLDICSIEAVSMDIRELALVRADLEKAKLALVDESVENVVEPTSAVDKFRSLGSTVLTRARSVRESVI